MDSDEHALEVTGEFAKFVGVGIASTILYAILTALLSYKNMELVYASVFSYIISAIFSYLSHRLFTFQSKNSPAREVWKFVSVALFSLGVSTAVMAVVSAGDMLKWIGIGIVCVAIPACNFIALKLWVFAFEATPPL